MPANLEIITTLALIINYLWLIPFLMIMQAIRKKDIEYSGIGKFINTHDEIKRLWKKILILIVLWILAPLLAILLPENIAYVLILKLLIVIYLIQQELVLYNKVRSI